VCHPDHLPTLRSNAMRILISLVRHFHPRMSSRFREFKSIEMDGGHEVIFTRPAELADKIVQASSD